MFLSFLRYFIVCRSLTLTYLCKYDRERWNSKIIYIVSIVLENYFWIKAVYLWMWNDCRLWAVDESPAMLTFLVVADKIWPFLDITLAQHCWLSHKFEWCQTRVIWQWQCSTNYTFQISGKIAKIYWFEFVLRIFSKKGSRRLHDTVFLRTLLDLRRNRNFIRFSILLGLS